MMVKILEICRVPPPPNSPNLAADFSLPLTYFDTFWFKFPPVERLFFFRLAHPTPSFFHSVVLPKLKHSLSLALLHYLPLAGNLIWPSSSPIPTLLYVPKDGVSFTVAESDADFEALSSDAIRNAVDAHPFIPKLSTSDERTELISLQITLFKDHGFSIGVTAHHAVLDGKSTMSFLKSWAYLCRQGNGDDPSLPSELVPFLDRTVIKDPAGLAELYLNQWIDFVGAGQDDQTRRSVKVLETVVEFPPDTAWATFVLSKANIESLRKKVSAKLDDSKRCRLSGFVLTFAYAITRKLKAVGVGADRPIAFAFMADYRTRLDPPVPGHYFGNCVRGLFGHIEPAEGFIDDENGLALTVSRITDMIERMEWDPQAGWENLAQLMLSWIRAKALGEIEEFFGVAGSPRFGVYGLDFGWGRPEKVEIISVDRSGAVAMAESRDGSGGIEIALAMKKHQMATYSALFADGLKEIEASF